MTEDPFDTIKAMMASAATRDFIAQRHKCEQCGGSSFKCTNRAFVIDTMFEDFECQDCKAMFFHEIENY